jgi:hypothetical protein
LRVSRLLALAQAAERAPAPLVLGDGGHEVVAAVVGPQGVGEQVLRVRALPQEEIRDAHLTGRADHQIGIRRVGKIET